MGQGQAPRGQRSLGHALHVSVSLCPPAPWAEVTYGAVAADLLHSLLAAGAAPWLLQVHSLFVLDDNSCPLQQECSLLDFHPDARAEDAAGPSRTTLESCALWNK